ncbi:MAG: hypothetical protein ABFS08_08745 [Pseudomonadota bacterium]
MGKRHYLLGLLALLVMSCQGMTVQLAQADEAALISQRAVHNTSLAQLGYPAGIFFAENTLPQRYSLLFQLPETMEPEGGSLRFFYRGASVQAASRTFVISINGQRTDKLLLHLDDATHVLTLPIAAEDLKAGQLKVELEPVALGSAESCRGGRVTEERVRILSHSHLQVAYQRGPTTLRDYWLTLPDEVRLTLPAGAIDEPLFVSALEWVALLQRHGRKVRIIRLPELGEIVLAPRSEINRALAKQKPRGITKDLPWSDKENVGLLGYGGKNLMVITAPYPSARRFADEWPRLGSEATLDTQAASTRDERREVMLAAFNIDNSETVFRGSQQWRGTVTPWKLPPGTRPVAAVVDLKMPKALAGEVRRLYVHLNGRLVTSDLLESDRERHQIRVPFRQLQANNIYRMEIAVRSSAGERCTAAADGPPIGIDAASRLLLKDEDREVKELAALPTAYGAGFDLIVPQESRNGAERYLPLLGTLLNALAIAQADYRLLFYAKGEAPQPARNFMMVGMEVSPQLDVPLRLDRGRVALVDRQGAVLIDDAKLRRSLVLQAVRSGDHGGLWLYSGEQEGLPAIDAGLLGSADLLLYAKTHGTISIDTNQAGMMDIRYLDAPHWFESLYEERRHWLLGAWVLLTLAMLYLHFVSRRQRDVS